MTDSDEILRQYEKNGFAIIRNVIDQDLIGEARTHVAWLRDRHPELRPEHLHHPLIRNDAFWVRLVTDERIVNVVERILGADLACFTAHYICKPPLDGQPVLWHQDGAYWKLDPMEALAVWLALDATTPENGCLKMIPGSHRIAIDHPELRLDLPNMLYSASREALVREWVDSAGEVDILLDPGDISIHHPNLLHRSGPNTSPRQRCGLDIGFIRTSTRLSNKDLYLDPILVRGEPAPGTNRYRAWPRYHPANSIAFRGHEHWNAMVAERNALGSFAQPDDIAETPIETTRRMIQRLRQGSVKT